MQEIDQTSNQPTSWLWCKQKILKGNHHPNWPNMCVNCAHQAVSCGWLHMLFSTLIGLFWVSSCPTSRAQLVPGKLSRVISFHSAVRCLNVAHVKRRSLLVLSRLVYFEPKYWALTSRPTWDVVGKDEHSPDLSCVMLMDQPIKQHSFPGRLSLAANRHVNIVRTNTLCFYSLIG